MYRIWALIFEIGPVMSGIGPTMNLKKEDRGRNELTNDTKRDMNGHKIRNRVKEYDD